MALRTREGPFGPERSPTGPERALSGPKEDGAGAPDSSGEVLSEAWQSVVHLRRRRGSLESRSWIQRRPSRSPFTGTAAAATTSAYTAQDASKKSRDMRSRGGTSPPLDFSVAWGAARGRGVSKPD